MTRFGYFIVTYLMALFVIVTWIFRPAPRLLWNASPSVPVGLYAMAHLDTLAPGDLVAVKPPETLARYMAERHYLPLGLPLIKHVGALPGQTICRRGLVISVDGRPVAAAQRHDHNRRTMPAWNVCHVIHPNEVFLLNASVPASFDGRYFGVLSATAILGRAVPLWIQGQTI